MPLSGANAPNHAEEEDEQVFEGKRVESIVEGYGGTVDGATENVAANGENSNGANAATVKDVEEGEKLDPVSRVEERPARKHSHTDEDATWKGASQNAGISGRKSPGLNVAKHVAEV